MVDTPVDPETDTQTDESRIKKAGGQFGKTVDWAVKIGSAAGAYLAIAAAFHFGPFSEPPDVRIDVASSQINSPGSDNGSDEYICLVNKSDSDVDLLGWELRDAEGSVNFLPDVILAPEQHLKVHPGEGRNTASDVYGEGHAAVWNNEGDTATLLDDSGNKIDSQTYGARSSETTAASCRSP